MLRTTSSPTVTLRLLAISSQLGPKGVDESPIGDYHTYERLNYSLRNISDVLTRSRMEPRSAAGDEVRWRGGQPRRSSPIPQGGARRQGLPLSLGGSGPTNKSDLPSHGYHLTEQWYACILLVDNASRNSIFV